MAASSLSRQLGVRPRLEELESRLVPSSSKPVVAVDPPAPHDPVSGPVVPTVHDAASQDQAQHGKTPPASKGPAAARDDDAAKPKPPDPHKADKAKPAKPPKNEEFATTDTVPTSTVSLSTQVGSEQQSNGAALASGSGTTKPAASGKTPAASAVQSEPAVQAASANGADVTLASLSGAGTPTTAVGQTTDAAPAGTATDTTASAAPTGTPVEASGGGRSQTAAAASGGAGLAVDAAVRAAAEAPLAVELTRTTLAAAQAATTPLVAAPGGDGRTGLSGGATGREGEVVAGSRAAPLPPERLYGGSAEGSGLWEGTEPETGAVLPVDLGRAWLPLAADQAELLTDFQPRLRRFAEGMLGEAGELAHLDVRPWLLALAVGGTALVVARRRKRAEDAVWENGPVERWAL